MGQQRLKTPKADDVSRQPQGQQRKKSNNTVLNNTATRKGEVFRAQRRTSDDVNARASQHVINVPVNKSIYNGYDGKQFSLKDQPKGRRPVRPTLKIIPIGGVGEMGIGKNMTAFEYDDEIIVVDMGFLFPGADYPGINYITPDITWLEENKHKIRGHVFTHGHLDHIGAFRHLISKIPAPVYAGEFTTGMLKRTKEETNDGYEPEYNVLDPEKHERAQLGDNFSVELVRVNHSIPDASAVVIRTPLGNVLCSGDWRIEENPVDGKKFDFDRMTEIASKEGILAFLNESTNCESEGTNMAHGEHDVGESIGAIMDKYGESRIIISSFSSMIHRMQLILEEAKQHERKVAFAGYSMIQNLEVALRAGVIKVPKDVIVKMEDLIKLPDNKVTVVCTGSQGEFNAVLSRMASGSHKHLKVKQNDVVVFSSSVVPGNEKYVVRTVDGLMREGSEVLQDKKTHLTGVGRLHLSGHGYYEDHVRLVNALNPTYYIPYHGEYHMLVHNARLAEKENGIPRKNIFVCDPGDVIEITHDGAKKVGRIPVGGVMYDDSGTVVSEVVLKDRIHMSHEGIFMVVLTVQRGSGRLMTSPDIISRGFIYMRDSEELMNTIRQYLKQKVARSFSGKKVDMDVLKKELRDEITHILFDQTRRTPIVIPVVNEIGGAKPQGQKSNAGGNNNASDQGRRTGSERPAPKKFPQPQEPDSEAQVPKDQHNRSY
jgi:ribonuclease J